MTRRSDGLISPIVALSRRVIQDVKRETLIVGQAISSAMQPWKGGIGNAAIAGAAVQLWHLSGSSSSAVTAQRQQQLSYYSSAAPAAQQIAAISAQTALQPESTAMQPCSLCSHAAVPPCMQPCMQLCSLAAMQPCSLAALQPCSHAALQP